MPSRLTRPSVFPRRNGFTLIELLVVISIISLLVAILLPALAAAQKAAIAAQCAANIRSVGQALSFYHTDNKGWSPDTSVTLDPSSQANWDLGWQKASATYGSNLYAGKYGGYQAKLLYYQYIPATLNYANRNGIKTGDLAAQVFACPADRISSGNIPLSYLGNRVGCLDLNSVYDGGYPSGSMGFFSGSSGIYNVFTGAANPPGYGIMSNIERYAYPSSYFLLAETNVPTPFTLYDLLGGNNSGSSHQYVSQVFYRFINSTTINGLINHNTRSNVLFADMHVNMLGQDGLCFPTYSTSSSFTGAPTTEPNWGRWGLGNATRRNWTLNRSAILLNPLLP